MRCRCLPPPPPRRRAPDGRRGRCYSRVSSRCARPTRGPCRARCRRPGRLRAGGLSLEGVAVVVRLRYRGTRSREGGLLEVEGLDDLFLVELVDGLAAHLLEDQTEQHVVGVGVEPRTTGIEQRGLLDADTRHLFG